MSSQRSGKIVLALRVSRQTVVSVYPCRVSFSRARGGVRCVRFRKTPEHWRVAPPTIRQATASCRLSVKQSENAIGPSSETDKVLVELARNTPRRIALIRDSIQPSCARAMSGFVRRADRVRRRAGFAA
jgi:hypothetical protein